MINSPFVWYDSLVKQARYSETSCCYKLWLTQNAGLTGYEMIPFTVKVPTAWGVATQFRLYDNTGALISNMDSLIATLLNSPVVSDGRLIVYSGGILTGVVTTGCYYLKLHFTSGDELFSEIVHFTNGLADTGNTLARLVWYDTCDIGGIPYGTLGFKHFLNIEALSVIDKVTILEEGVENAAKEFTPTLQKFTNEYLIEEYLPQYLLQSLAQLQLHNNIRYYPDWKKTAYVDVKQPKVTITYDDDNNAGIFKLTFIGDELVKTACCDTINIVTPDSNFAVGTLSNIVVTIIPETMISGRGVQINGDITGVVTAVYVSGFPSNVPTAGTAQATIGGGGTNFQLVQPVPAATYTLKIYPVRVIGAFTIKGTETTVTAQVV